MLSAWRLKAQLHCSQLKGSNTLGSVSLLVSHYSNLPCWYPIYVNYQSSSQCNHSSVVAQCQKIFLWFLNFCALCYWKESLLLLHYAQRIPLSSRYLSYFVTLTKHLCNYCRTLQVLTDYQKGLTRRNQNHHQQERKKSQKNPDKCFNVNSEKKTTITGKYRAENAE